MRALVGEEGRERSEDFRRSGVLLELGSEVRALILALFLNPGCGVVPADLPRELEREVVDVGGEVDDDLALEDRRVPVGGWRERFDIPLMSCCGC